MFFYNWFLGVNFNAYEKCYQIQLPSISNNTENKIRQRELYTLLKTYFI